MYQGTGYDQPKIIKNAQRWFASLCSINAPDTTLVNGVRTGTFTPVTGLQNIPCMNAPISAGGIQATEVKALQEIESVSIREVLLNGYYAQLDGLNWGEVGWQAVVDSLTYDILGAERDSQKVITRLKLRLVTL